MRNQNGDNKEYRFFSKLLLSVVVFVPLATNSYGAERDGHINGTWYLNNKKPKKIVNKNIVRALEKEFILLGFYNTNSEEFKPVITDSVDVGNSSTSLAMGTCHCSASATPVDLVKTDGSFNPML